MRKWGGGSHLTPYTQHPYLSNGDSNSTSRYAVRETQDYIKKCVANTVDCQSLIFGKTGSRNTLSSNCLCFLPSGRYNRGFP